MVIGSNPPFYAETPRETVKKVVQWTHYLLMPKEPRISSASKDFIYKLICSPKKRMTYRQLKRHPWMTKVPWHDLRSMRPPFIPRVKAPCDTKYFDKIESTPIIRCFINNKSTK